MDTADGGGAGDGAGDSGRRAAARRMDAKFLALEAAALLAPLVRRDDVDPTDVRLTHPSK